MTVRTVLKRTQWNKKTKGKDFLMELGTSTSNLPKKRDKDMVACYAANPLANTESCYAKQTVHLREGRKELLPPRFQSLKELFHVLQKRGLSSSTVTWVTLCHWFLENRVSHMMGGLSVFVDSSQDSLPRTAVLPMSRLEQLLLGSPLGTANEQASEFLMSGMANDLCCQWWFYNWLFLW